MLRDTLAATAVAALASGALADDFPVPSGFNLESGVLALPIHGVLDDGRLLLTTGEFGDDKLRVLELDGSTTLFATGFGSLAGFAQAADGTILVGDSFSFGSMTGADLVELRDLNGDGDALDPGETTAFPVPLPPMSDTLTLLPFGLAFRPGTDELYVSGSTFSPVGGVVRIADGVATPYAEGMGFAGNLAWADGERLLVADPGLGLDGQGRVVSLTDANADGDALDAGEAVDFAAGFTGSSGLAIAADGTVYLSATTASDGSKSVSRLLADRDDDGSSDGVDVDWATGFGFSTGLTLIEGPGGLVAGADGDGRLYVTDFFDPFPAPPIIRSIRSAPLASVSIDGTVAANSAFDLVADAALGAAVSFVLSLDQSSNTIPGLGDICLGFGAPFAISPMVPADGTGEARLPVIFHGLEAAVGLEFTLQAFAFQNGDIGISNALDVTIEP